MRKESRRRVEVLCFTLIMCMVGIFPAGCGRTTYEGVPIDKNSLEYSSTERFSTEEIDSEGNNDMGGEYSGQSEDILSGIQVVSPKETVLGKSGDVTAIADFGIRLFRECASDEKNTLISPLSIICALAMTSGGAREETLSQIEEVFGVSIPDLREYLHAYINHLPSEDKYQFHLANSIWIREDEALKIEEDFLQVNKKYFNAEIKEAPFNNATIQDINAWVDENTQGMIPDILQEIPEEAVMYLINALAFDAEWEKIYNEHHIRDGKFIKESGEEWDVKLMYETEHAYLEGEHAEGFIKYYADRKYGFAALVPKEGLAMEEFLDTLTGENLIHILENVQNIPVETAIPKFETDYNILLNDALQEMGIEHAFNMERANFTGIGTHEEGNLFISEVIHKTFLSVDEKGTKAGAATLVEIQRQSAVIDMKRVILDRPFFYMLIDCETNIPFFIGMMLTAQP